MVVSQSVDNVTTIDFRRRARPFAHRLETLCDGVVSRESEADQYITVACDAVEPPAASADIVLQVAREFVSNAVTHGMHMRLLGRIEVSVVTIGAGLVLKVVDDGWGCGTVPLAGEGLSLARRLASTAGGEITLARVGHRTVAEMTLARLIHA